MPVVPRASALDIVGRDELANPPFPPSGAYAIYRSPTEGGSSGSPVSDDE